MKFPLKMSIQPYLYISIKDCFSFYFKSNSNIDSLMSIIADCFYQSTTYFVLAISIPKLHCFRSKPFFQPIPNRFTAIVNSFSRVQQVLHGEC